MKKSGSAFSISFLLSILWLIFLVGCGTVSVPTEITHPAEFNMTQYKQIPHQAKMGEMAEAIRIFSGAAETSEANSDIKPKSVANAYWNLRLAYEYTWKFDKAIEGFKKPYGLNPIKAYLKEKTNAEKLNVHREKLEEQGM